MKQNDEILNDIFMTCALLFTGGDPLRLVY